MTIPEEEELFALAIFVNNSITRFSAMNLPTPITEAFGSGAWTEVQKLIRKGFVADLYVEEFEFTIAGKTRYEKLRKKKRKDTMGKLLIWAISFCTFLTAGDVVYKWFKPSDAKSEPKALEVPAKIQTKDTHTQTLPLDTIKAPSKDSLSVKPNK